jgi:hypothetical protein
VAGLVELLGIERGTNTEGQTRVDLGVVGDRGNTTVVDLGLSDGLASETIVRWSGNATYLGEGERVKLVLGGKLNADGLAGGEVVRGLETSLNVGVDLLVVRSSDEAEVVGGSQSTRVGGGLVTESSGVAGDGGLLDVVASLSTGKVTLVASDSVDDGREVASSRDVGESTDMEVRLLEVEVDLLTLVTLVGSEAVEDLGLQTLRNGVVELDLAVEDVGGAPALGDGNA